jgi:hypothetical protein
VRVYPFRSGQGLKWFLDRVCAAVDHQWMIATPDLAWSTILMLFHRSKRHPAQYTFAQSAIKSIAIEIPDAGAQTWVSRQRG